MKSPFILTLLLFLASIVQAQNKVDSLFTELKKWENKTGIAADSNLYSIYFNIGVEFQYSNPDTAIYFFKKCQTLGKKMKQELKEGSAINEQGWCYFLKGEYDRAKWLYENSLSIAEKHLSDGDNIEAKKLEIANLSSIGSVYYLQGNYIKALEYYFKTLKKNEEIDNKPNIASNLANIGSVYSDQENHQKALEYSFKALKMNEQIGNKKNIASNLANIGRIYWDLGVNASKAGDEILASEKYLKAQEHITKSLLLSEEIGNKQIQAVNLGNLGSVYYEQGISASRTNNEKLAQDFYAKSIEYSFKALKINEEIGNKKSRSVNLGSIGAVYIKQGKFEQAQLFLHNAIKIGEDLKIIFHLKKFYQSLSDLYTQTGRHKEALEAYKKHIACRDSVMSEENQKALVQKEMQYEFDKKEALQKAEQEKKDAIAKQELEKQTLQRNGFIIGFILMLALAGVVFRSYRIKQKANLIITQQKQEVEKQKELIEQKQKEILDSIRYAKRIQDCMMPKEKIIARNIHKLHPFR